MTEKETEPPGQPTLLPGLEATEPGAAGSEGWVEARRSCAAQTVAPTSDRYDADAYFGSSGDAHLTAGNIGTTGVRFVSMDRYTCLIQLDKTDFPPGLWEIVVML